MIKDRRTYELFQAGEVGREVEGFVAGVHSGSEGILDILAGRGITTSREIARKMLPSIRSLAIKHKRALSSEEVASIFHQSTVIG
jgi:isopropylmalate/homocitrate/citramalate synthase